MLVFTITGEEIDAWIEVRDILKPLLWVTQEVCYEKFVSLSKTIKLSQEIETKYGNIESVKLYACATLVDPPYKKFEFQSIRDSARAITNIGMFII